MSGGTLSSPGVYSEDLRIPLGAFAAGLGDHMIVTTLCPDGKERTRRLMKHRRIATRRPRADGDASAASWRTSRPLASCQHSKATAHSKSPSHRDGRSARCVVWRRALAGRAQGLIFRQTHAPAHRRASSRSPSATRAGSAASSRRGSSPRPSPERVRRARCLCPQAPSATPA